MVKIVVSLTDKQATELKNMAASLGLTVEDLARLGVADLLMQSKTEFEKTLTYILNKNRDLYERLA